MPALANQNEYQTDIFDLGLVAGIGLHLWLQQQTGLSAPAFPSYFPAFLPAWAVIPWSASCIWFGIKTPDLKGVFQCLSGFLLFAASAPVLAVLRLPIPFLENGSSACVSLVFAWGAGLSLVARSFEVNWSEPQQSALFRAWSRVPCAGAMGAFGLSLALDAWLGQTPLVAALTGWSFSLCFALTWVWVGRIPPAWAVRNLRSPDLWRRWLAERAVLWTAAIMILSGSAVALALRYWKLFQMPTPDRYLQEIPWGPRYVYLTQQGLSLWFPLAVILFMQTLVILRIQRIAQLRLSSIQEQDLPAGTN